MLFFTESAINILAIAVLVQDDNQEIASVGYVWRPSGRETNNTDPLTWYPRPWWQQRAGGGWDVGWRGPWLGGTVRRPWNTQVKEITEGDPVRGDCANWNKRNFHKKKKHPLYASQGWQQERQHQLGLDMDHLHFILSVDQQELNNRNKSQIWRGFGLSSLLSPNLLYMSWTWKLLWHVLDMKPSLTCLGHDTCLF